MSNTISFNGSNFIIPSTNEVGWGNNVSSYLIAIAAGCLQKTGGSFTLSAETDFGASYGLKSLYYKSRSSNLASTGIVRLSNNGDAVSWRNAANGGDLALLANGSDQLQFNGSTLIDTAGSGLSKSGTTLSISAPVSVANGGTGDTSLTAYAVLCGGTTSTGAVQSVASVGSSGQVLTSNGAGALPTFQNVSGTGTVNSGTASRLSLYASSTNAVSDTYVQNTHNITLAIAAQASRSANLALTIPNPGNAITAANFVLDQGDSSLAGSLAVTKSSTTAFSVGSTLIVDTTSANSPGGTVSIGANATPGTPVLNLEIDQDDGTVLRLANGNNTAGATARLNVIVGGGSASDAFTDYVVTGGGSWAVGVDNSDSDKFKVSAGGALGTNDAIIASSSGPAVSIHGTITNDNAPAGYVGETVVSSPGSYSVFPTTNNLGDYTSISLTAGDWLVSGVLDCLCKSSTTDTFYAVGISTTTGNSATGLVVGDNYVVLQPAGGGLINFSNTITVPSYRLSLASPATVYLKFKAQYSSTVPQAQGRISAVRIR